jgi:erythromycin esterase
MRKGLVLALVLSLLPFAAQADSKPFLDLDFEMPECAGGWYPDWSVIFDWGFDEAVRVSGRQSLKIQVAPNAVPFPYGSVVRNMPASEVAGKRVRLSGFLRTEDVGDYASIWFASLNAGGGFSYVDLSGQAIRGTTPWTRYSMEIDIPASAQNIIFGPEVSGGGTAWFDGLELEIDGKKWADGGAPPLLSPSPGHIDWLRRTAIPFDTQRAGNGFADLQPLKSVIGDARIVSLGEATHGTREFFEMKHRLLEFLATEMGFKYFSIEAYMPEAQKINEYVLTGQGDPVALLKGLRFWTWNTQEVLDMILWMRAFNASGRGPVQFTGFDMQSTRLAVPNVRAFLLKADAAYLPVANSAFARIAAAERRGSATAEDVAAARGVVDHMTARREAYLQGYSREEVDWAIQNARIVVQKAEDLAGITGRDESMAKNVEWLVDQAPAGSKFVLWAHNGHVNRKPDWMGHYLDQRFGDDMYVLGFAFREGSYNAVGPFGLGSNAEPPPPQGSLETFLQAPGIPRFILDLRNLNEDAPMIWLRKPRPLRSIGAVAQRCSFGINPTMDEYDGLIWIETSTPSTLLPF